MVDIEIVDELVRFVGVEDAVANNGVNCDYLVPVIELHDLVNIG